MRMVKIEIATGRVDNIIEILPKTLQSGWSPGEGYELLSYKKTARIGGTWDGSKFTPPIPLPPTREALLRHKVIGGIITDDEKD